MSDICKHPFSDSKLTNVYGNKIDIPIENI